MVLVNFVVWSIKKRRYEHLASIWLASVGTLSILFATPLSFLDAMDFKSEAETHTEKPADTCHGFIF